MKMKEKSFKMSNFSHVVSLSSLDYVAIYNALTMGLVVVRSDLVDALKKGKMGKISSTTFRQLKSAKMVNLPFRNDASDLDEAKDFFHKKILGVLCLMLTESCNLRCRYCFVEHRFPVTHVFRQMTPDMAKQGIDAFVKRLPESLGNGLRDPVISFYGGEPLLNLPVLKWSLEYISMLKEKGRIPKNTFLTLNTNGTLVTAEVVEMLGKHNVAVSLSLDGHQLIHDMARADTCGKGSFGRALNGVSVLKEGGIDVGISCAVAMHNINQLESSAEFFMDDVGISVFGFNILVDGGLPEPAFDLVKYSENVAEKMVNCFRLARQKGKQEERSFRLAKSFADGFIHYYDCSACGQQLVVDPRGRFGPCHAYLHSDKNFFFPDHRFDAFSHPVWEEWRKRSPINMQQCQNCIALGICGGGCPYNAEARAGSIWEVDESFCPFARSMVTFLVKE